MPEQLRQPEGKKFALVIDLISTREQEYVDPKKRWAHNDLYPTTKVEVVKIGADGRVLCQDNTGEYWIPGRKLQIL